MAARQVSRGYYLFYEEKAMKSEQVEPVGIQLIQGKAGAFWVVVFVLLS